MNNLGLPENDLNNDATELINPSFLNDNNQNNNVNEVLQPPQVNTNQPVMQNTMQPTNNIMNQNNFVAGTTNINSQSVPNYQNNTFQNTPNVINNNQVTNNIQNNVTAGNMQPKPNMQNNAGANNNQQPNAKRGETAISRILDGTDDKLTLDEEYLLAFIGPNAEKFLGKQFNWSSFFFMGIYYFYRKMFSKGLLLAAFYMAVNLIFEDIIGIGILTTIVSFSVSLLIGFATNSNYINYAQEEIEKIKAAHPTATKEQIIALCKSKGGTSAGYAFVGLLIEIGIGFAISVIFALIGFASIVSDFIGPIKLKTSYNSNINYDTTTNTNNNDGTIKIDLTGNDEEFNGAFLYDASLNPKTAASYSVPKGYEEDSIGVYEYNEGEAGIFADCELSVHGLLNYKDAKTLAPQIAKKYNTGNPTVVNSNGYTWYKVSYGDSFGSTTMYLTNYKNKPLMIEMEIRESGLKDKCTTDLNKFFESFKLK